MRLLQAILMVMLKLAEGGLKGLDWLWRFGCSLWPFGGGRSATPGPLDLPSKDLYEVDRSLAESQQRAADVMANDNPARQIKMFSSAKPDDRFGVDLSLLDSSQHEWLTELSTNERAMRTLSETPESKILMLLGGHDGAVPGLDAPKIEKAKKIIPGLSDRILDFRLLKSARERDHALAA